MSTRIHINDSGVEEAWTMSRAWELGRNPAMTEAPWRKVCHYSNSKPLFRTLSISAGYHYQHQCTLRQEEETLTKWLTNCPLFSTPASSTTLSTICTDSFGCIGFPSQSGYARVKASFISIMFGRTLLGAIFHVQRTV